MSSVAKNEKIKQTMQATRERHKNMTCRVFELKLNTRKMSSSQREQLTRYFREAKWRRNSIVADFASASRKAKSAMVKVGDVLEGVVKGYEAINTYNIFLPRLYMMRCFSRTV